MLSNMAETLVATIIVSFCIGVEVVVWMAWADEDAPAVPRGSDQETWH